MRIKTAILLPFALLLALTGCGESTTDPGPADAVTDALYQSLRDSIVSEFKKNELDSAFSDSLFQTVYDSVYANEVERLQAQHDSLTLAHSDSLQQAQDSINTARDSIQALSIAAAADSIYETLYAQIYDEIYSSSAAKNIWATASNYHPTLSPADQPYLQTLYGEGDPQGQLFSITLTNTGTQTYYKVLVEAEVPGFTQTLTQTDYINVKDTVTFTLNPSLLYEAWANLTAVQKAQLNYRVKVLNNDREILVLAQSLDIEIWPANMNPAFHTRKDGTPVDMDSYTAHWVQPQADSVQAVIESARKLHADNKLVGYQDPSSTGNHASIVRAQAEAIYKALQARGIGYVTSADLGNAGQVVLFPNQTLRHRYANCIDGAVLFASALERIGIETAIIFIPGHAFIGYRLWDDVNTWDFLETTLTWSGGTFAQALASGNSRYNSEVSAGHFTSGTSAFMKIPEARKLGYAAYPYDLEF